MLKQARQIQTKQDHKEKKFFSVFVIKAVRSERSGKVTCFQLFESLSLLFPFSRSEKSYEMKTARLWLCQADLVSESEQL